MVLVAVDAPDFSIKEVQLESDVVKVVSADEHVVCIDPTYCNNKNNLTEEAIWIYFAEPTALDLGPFEPEQQAGTGDDSSQELMRQRLYSKNFAYDSYTLKGDLSALSKLLDAAKAHPEAKIAIEGHTDSRGTSKYNLVLSYHRAQAVARWLMKQHVDPRRISIKGYGETRPIAENTTDEGREKNRRADVVLKVVVASAPSAEEAESNEVSGDMYQEASASESPAESTEGVN